MHAPGVAAVAGHVLDGQHADAGEQPRAGLTGAVAGRSCPGQLGLVVTTGHAVAATHAGGARALGLGWLVAELDGQRRIFAA